MARTKWNIGCSGFSYKDWKLVFYPEKLTQSKWFAFYCEHFNTLELNVSFYKFPTAEQLRKWYDKSPVDFSFSVKAPRLITHYRQLLNTEQWLIDFYTACREGLAEKLGACLFQFPPKFSYSEERLARITANLDTSFTNVVEFRHSSWWNEDVYKALSKKKIVFCGSSYPGLPDDIVVNGATLYYRFHGIEKLFYSAYEEKLLEEFAAAIHDHKKIKQAYCYFNNTATMAAINNAKWLQGFAKPKNKKLTN